MDEEAEAVKKAFLEQRSDSEDEGGDAIRQGILLDDKIVPKTPENAPTPPASPKAQPRAAIAEPRQAKKALVEERTLKRPAEAPAEQPVEAGQSMDAEESRKRRSETEVEVLSQGSPTRSRLEPDASPSTRTLYPPSFAGNVARVEVVEGMTVATVYESGDEYLFGADNGEEEYSMDFGENKEELLSFCWDDADCVNCPIVSGSHLSELDEAAFEKEVTRLQEMNVLRKAKRSDLDSDYKELSTTAVQYWRHRDGVWQRIRLGQGIHVGGPHETGFVSSIDCIRPNTPTGSIGHGRAKVPVVDHRCEGRFLAGTAEEQSVCQPEDTNICWQKMKFGCWKSCCPAKGQVQESGDFSSRKPWKKSSTNL